MEVRRVAPETRRRYQPQALLPPGGLSCKLPRKGTAIASPHAVGLTVIAGTANLPLASSIAHELGLSLAERSIQRFPDGELHVRIGQTVRGHDVYVVQPTSRSADEHMMELLFLGDACKRAGAARLTALLPYFGYARQDRRVSGREAVGATVVARLIEAVGFSRVVTVDLHTPAIEGFFRIPVEHLSAIPLLAAAVPAAGDSVIVAPDLGAVKLAERYHSLLHVPVVVLHKARVGGSDVSVRRIIGDVRGRAPFIVDDMITTGGTIEAAVKTLLDAGCTPAVSIAATHAIFVGPAVARLEALPIHRLVGTNSVEATQLPTRFQVVNLAPLLAKAIERLHRDQSLASLVTGA